MGYGRLRDGQHRHRFPGNLCSITISFTTKKSLFPEGNKDRKYISAVPPCLPQTYGRSVTVPTHRLPGNAGIASEDTWDFSRSPCPQRPICEIAFRSPLSYGELSVDALSALLPPQWFLYRLCLLYNNCVPLSSSNFRRPRTQNTHGKPPLWKCRMWNSECKMQNAECRMVVCLRHELKIAQYETGYHFIQLHKV